MRAVDAPPDGLRQAPCDCWISRALSSLFAAPSCCPLCALRFVRSWRLRPVLRVVCRACVHAPSPGLRESACARCWHRLIAVCCVRLASAARGCAMRSALECWVAKQNRKRKRKRTQRGQRTSPAATTREHARHKRTAARHTTARTPQWTTVPVARREDRSEATSSPRYSLPLAAGGRLVMCATFTALPHLRLRFACSPCALDRLSRLCFASCCAVLHRSKRVEPLWLAAASLSSLAALSLCRCCTHLE